MGLALPVFRQTAKDPGVLVSVPAVVGRAAGLGVDDIVVCW